MAEILSLKFVDIQNEDGLQLLSMSLNMRVGEGQTSCSTAAYHVYTVVVELGPQTSPQLQVYTETFLLHPLLPESIRFVCVGFWDSVHTASMVTREYIYQLTGFDRECLV